MQIAHRKALVASLVSAFILQAILVYRDSTASSQAPLNAQELRGRAYWHRHNCGSCHQIYGFGGFLGPDLTNAGGRIPRTRLADALRQGLPPMPAFPATDAEIDDLYAYLQAIDRSGIGQARRYPAPPLAAVNKAIEQHTARAALSSDQQAGKQLFEQRCAFCHRPMMHTPLGWFVAPDLSLSLATLGEKEVDRVLQEGRLTRGMPPAGMSDSERKQVIGYLYWLQQERDVLLKECGVTETDVGLPWWEYR